MSISSRECALKILYDIENGAYSDAAVKHGLSIPMEMADKRLITEIVYGVVANRTRLDYIVKNYSNVPMRKISYWVKNILRMGIYQMLFLDKIPPNAAVNESVNLAKRYGHTGSVGFVNAVLRSVSNNGDVEYPKELSIYHSYPEWLVEMWIREYGEEAIEELLVAGNKRIPITLRPNKLKTTVGELIQKLESENVTTKLVGDMVEISGSGSIERLKAFTEGLCTVQGIPSADTVKCLDPQAGETVIDVCAAPGGKTTYIAECMNNNGQVVAMDRYAHKIDIINKNCQRLGVDIVESIHHDSQRAFSKYIGQADRVLVDAPCSGLGNIGSKPDIKWRKLESDIEALEETQQRILVSSDEYLKPSGVMVYSTCTISKRENDDIVNWFCESNNYTKLYEKQYFPHVDGTNGFYIAKMRKN